MEVLFIWNVHCTTTLPFSSLPPPVPPPSLVQLWALLHFIMPTMFDSHEEFNEWFSRDIESHAEKKGGLDENQLSRLHMILKPFMLRRIKRDVEHEMAEKVHNTPSTLLCAVKFSIILLVYCVL